MKTHLIVLFVLIPTIASSIDKNELLDSDSFHSSLITGGIILSPLLPLKASARINPRALPRKIRSEEAYKLARDYMRVGADRASRFKWEAFSNDYYGRKATKLELRKLAYYVMRVNR